MWFGILQLVLLQLIYMPDVVHAMSQLLLKLPFSRRYLQDYKLLGRFWNFTLLVPMFARVSNWYLFVCIFEPEMYTYQAKSLHCNDPALPNTAWLSIMLKYSHYLIGAHRNIFHEKLEVIHLGIGSSELPLMACCHYVWLSTHCSLLSLSLCLVFFLCYGRYLGFIC